MTAAEAMHTLATETSGTDDHLLPDELLRREVNVLVIDGDVQTSRIVEASLRPIVRRVDHAHDLGETLHQLQNSPYHVILADIEGKQSEEQHLHLCKYLSENRPDTAVVVLSDESRMQTAIAAMRAGAFDLVTKPLHRGAIERAVQRAASQALLERRLHRLADARAEVDSEEIIGKSEAVASMLDRIARVADTDVTILITGESGTGKELVARAMHDSSARSEAPFVAVNCAAIPSELLEAELFGHVKGAFTDAKKAKEGLFVRAQGGTLFLDEVGEMPADMQVKLLRALQERKVRPVGATAEVPFDVRLLAATNRNLESEVQAGKFREDLFYRLNVVRIHTPPLRERNGDILILAQHFVNRWSQRMNKRVTGLSSEAAHRLMEHDWPGNVRELENVMQRAVAMSRYDEIVPSDLGKLGPRSPQVESDREAAGDPVPSPNIATPTPTPEPAAMPGSAATPPATSHAALGSAEQLPPPMRSSEQQVAASAPGYAQPQPHTPNQVQPMSSEPQHALAYAPPAQPQPTSTSASAYAAAPATPEPMRRDYPYNGGYPAQPGAPRGHAPGHLPLRRTTGTEVEERPMLERLQAQVRNSLARLDIDGTDEIPTLEQLETMYILEMLRACDGNKTKASTMLGMARRTLYRRLKQMDVEDGSAMVAERSHASPVASAVTEDVI